jgi:hypothetical protein
MYLSPQVGMLYPDSWNIECKEASIDTIPRTWRILIVLAAALAAVTLIILWPNGLTFLILLLVGMPAVWSLTNALLAPPSE